MDYWCEKSRILASGSYDIKPALVSKDVVPDSLMYMFCGWVNAELACQQSCVKWGRVSSYFIPYLVRKVCNRLHTQLALAM